MSGDLMQTSPHGPMIWKVMQRNVWSDMASWLAKQLSSFTKSQLHALMTIHFKEAELGCVGELSVNTLVRSVTKWTRPCDKCLACLISYIHHTNDYRQYCHVGNTAQHCLWVYSTTQILLGCSRLQVNLGWNLMHLRKSNICLHK